MNRIWLRFVASSCVPGCGPRSDAKIANDNWQLVALANTMVTDVRQRAMRELLGRRCTTADPVWVNRLLLFTGVDHLSPKQWNAAARHVGCR